MKVWEDAGEAVIWRAVEARDDRETLADDGAQGNREPDGEANRLRAAQRARTTLRRFATSNALDWLVTLTYRPPQPTDPYSVLRDVQAFQRRLEAARPEVVWARVFELHKSGALHVHFLMSGSHRGERATRALARLWGHGFVDAKRFGNGGRGGARKAARYGSKYVSKGAVAGFGRHSYEVRQGFPPGVQRSAVATREDAWSTAVRAMGGEIPAYEWESVQLPDWRGPPVMFLQWD